MHSFRKLTAVAVLALAASAAHAQIRDSYGGTIHGSPAAAKAALPAGVTAATACVQGVAGAVPTVTLTFTPPTTNTDGTAITLPLTYSVFQGTTSGGEVSVATGVTGSPVVLNTGITYATTYYVYIKAVDANGASVPSTEMCKTIPAAPSIPNPVVNVVVS